MWAIQSVYGIPRPSLQTAADNLAAAADAGTLLIYVAASWSLLESSRETGGLPGVYLIKSLIPLAAALVLLQGLALAARSFVVLFGEQEVATAPKGADE